MKIHMQSKPYFRKILLLTCGAVLSICLILSAILYIKTESVTTASFFQSENERTENLHERIGIFLNQFIRKNTVFSGMHVPYEEIGLSASYWTREIFQRMFISHTNADSFTENIDIMVDKHSVFPSPISHERILGEFSVFTIYAEDTIAWPYYFDLESINVRGQNRVTITVNGYHLSKSVFSYKDDTHKDYLLLPDGTVLLTNQKTAFMHNINDIYPDLLLMLNQNNNEDSICRYDGYYCFLSEEDKFGFSVLSLVDENIYLQQRRADITGVLIIAIVSLFFALLVSSLLSIVFYRPVKNTVNLVRTYISEDILDYENEISFITKNISRYLDKETKMETALPEMVKKTQEAQAAVLQHQINSHFLFNTLENIKAISVEELGAKNEIEEGIALLNSIIRESIFHKNILVPLEHEIYLANNYLALMKMRFTNVVVNWNVDESLLKCLVFKFSLQPVLENCFAHAFKDRTRHDNLITIDVMTSAKDEFVVSITDNGSSIDEATAKRINHMLNQEDTGESAANHVGLRNVHKRIRTVFGPEYGISISRTAGKTVALIHYPITKN